MQEKRLNEIQNYLKNHEICTYEELREYCDVSLSTIKRDIDFLDAEGRLLRIRGGARRLPSDPSSVGHFLRTVHTCYPFLFSAPAFALV